jgi:hypothetical protein
MEGHIYVEGVYRYSSVDGYYVVMDIKRWKPADGLVDGSWLSLFKASVAFKKSFMGKNIKISKIEVSNIKPNRTVAAKRVTSQVQRNFKVTRRR